MMIFCHHGVLSAFVGLPSLAEEDGFRERALAAADANYWKNLYIKGHKARIAALNSEAKNAVDDFVFKTALALLCRRWRLNKQRNHKLHRSRQATKFVVIL